MHQRDTRRESRESNEKKVDHCGKQISHREQSDCEVKSRGATDGVVGAFEIQVSTENLERFLKL